jgi:hypothetical protein
MNIHAFIDRVRGPAAGQGSQVKVGLSPEVLLREGILSDPGNPEQAYRRARGLIHQGRYKEARDLLCPHSRVEDPALSVKITGLLAQCAKHGSGGDWESLLNATFKGCLALGDEMGAAKARRDLGDMLVNVGRIDEGEGFLKDAADAFTRLGDRGRAAKVECLRARARLRAGYVGRALERVNAAIDSFNGLGGGRGLALARLERACILARRADNVGAARDLIAAEHFLASSGSAFDRLRARLARAECLHILGDSQRAVSGLKRVLVDVVDLEETSIRAYVHTLLGQACMELDAPASRQYLMRGRHLYQSLKCDYYVALCDIELARVEHRLGLNARGRLKQLTDKPVTEWPALASILAIARAEVCGGKESDRARQSLFRARAFAAESGNRSLLATVDRVLLTTGLATAEEMGPMTVVEGRGAEPIVQVGNGAEPGGSRRRPEPFTITDVSSDHGVVIRSRPERAARLIRPTVSGSQTVGLKDPRIIGVRRS